MGRLRRLINLFKHKEYPHKWIWQPVTWEDVREAILKEIERVKNGKT